MKRDTFTVIIVPHDQKGTKQYRIQYRLFYALVVLLGIGAVAMIIFVATYGRILLKAREAVMLEQQVREMTRRNEQVGELMRNLAQLRSMNLKVRRMLGLDISEEDSLAISPAMASVEFADEGLVFEQEQALYSMPNFWPVRGYITRGFDVSAGGIHRDSRFFCARVRLRRAAHDAPGLADRRHRGGRFFVGGVLLC